MPHSWASCSCLRGRRQGCEVKRALCSSEATSVLRWKGKRTPFLSGRPLEMPSDPDLRAFPVLDLSFLKPPSLFRMREDRVSRPPGHRQAGRHCLEPSSVHTVCFILTLTLLSFLFLRSIFFFNKTEVFLVEGQIRSIKFPSFENLT